MARTLLSARHRRGDAVRLSLDPEAVHVIAADAA